MYKLKINGKEKEFRSLKEIVSKMLIFQDDNFFSSSEDLIEFLRTRKAKTVKGEVELEVKDFNQFKLDAEDELLRAIISIQNFIKRFPKYKKDGEISIRVLEEAEKRVGSWK